ncbi:MAG TPA: helix-turn-helix domain-containing protein, partial [Vicinamibacterales bacterium]|nr:helix-turn-helix domain-containing protein [Vicinamibacterales bacterium]
LFAGTTATPALASGQSPQPCVQAVLTATEAAALLRIDVAVVERHAALGALPGRRLGSEWRFSCTALMTWLGGSEPPALGSATPLTAPEMAAIAAAGTRSVQAATTSAGASTTNESQAKPVGEAPQERAAEEIFLRSQRVLLGRGDVVMDFGQFYGRHDDHALASIGDAIGLSTVRQELSTTFLQARVGLFAETELFASVSFNDRENRHFFGNTDLSRDRQRTFGGTSLGIRRTLMKEGARRPNMIATFTGHVPTDDGPYLLGGGVVLVKSIDPAALFLNANYFETIRRGSSPAFGTTPDYTVDVSVGYALAVNDTLAVNMSVTGVFTGEGTTFDNTRLRQPSTFSARFGVTSWLARGLYVEPSLSFGLTGPGRSFAFGLTFPYSF